MSEGINEAIQKALDIALKTFATDNSIAYQLENGPLLLNGVAVEMSTSQPYLAGYLLPSPVDAADLYFTDRRAGIYQIDVNYASGVGTRPINRMTDLLNAAFKPGTVLTRSPVCLEITRFSQENLGGGNGWATKPVTIEWITYTERL
jgi:hypothetical protein